HLYAFICKAVCRCCRSLSGVLSVNLDQPDLAITFVRRYTACCVELGGCQFGAGLHCNSPLCRAAGEGANNTHLHFACMDGASAECQNGAQYRGEKLRCFSFLHCCLLKVTVVTPFLHALIRQLKHCRNLKFG